MAWKNRGIDRAEQGNLSEQQAAALYGAPSGVPDEAPVLHSPAEAKQPDAHEGVM